MVTIEHRDVIQGGFPDTLPLVDAAFFDLPDASAVIPAASKIVKQGGMFCCICGVCDLFAVIGRICTFCPCIEQTQRVIPALQKNGFGGISHSVCHHHALIT